MSDVVALKRAASKYSKLYGIKLTFGRLYDLKKDWKNYWPNNDDPGSYGVFCKNKSLLYVGKADHFGIRLGGHFRYDKRKLQGVPRESGWTKTPRYVLTIAVEEIWEAPSLERYLITFLEKRLRKKGRTLDNIRGKN